MAVDRGARGSSSPVTAPPVGRGRRDAPLLPWRRLGGALTTTADGVELGMLRSFTGLRIVNVVQTTLAVATLASVSPHPALDVVLLVVFVVETVLFVALCLRAGTVRRRRLVTADIVFGAVLLLLQPLIAREEHRIGSWEAWGYAVTLSCALLAGMALSRRWMWGAVVGLSAAYLVGGLQGNMLSGQLWSALTNVFGYGAFALVGAVISDYLRRLGAEADLQRGLAEQAAAEAERNRARMVLHDTASLLTRLGRGAADDAVLRRQATAGANAVTAFMAGVAGREVTDGESRCLADVVADAASAFVDLPITLNLDLARDLDLDPDLVRVVGGAVVTLLHNVRQHAQADTCVVHADATDDGRSWEVTVRDDGRGFDPASTSQGFGLSRQVRAAAEAAGLGVSVVSGPDEGTVVTLSWSAPVSSGSPGSPVSVGDASDGSSQPPDLLGGARLEGAATIGG